MEARNLEELKAMCEHPDYRLYFTRVKWYMIHLILFTTGLIFRSLIMQCVAEVVFSQEPFETSGYSSSKVKHKSVGFLIARSKGAIELTCSAGVEILIDDFFKFPF